MRTGILLLGTYKALNKELFNECVKANMDQQCGWLTNLFPPADRIYSEETRLEIGPSHFHS